MMKEISIYLVISIIMVIMVRYIFLLVRKEIKPALAMWLFFSIAISMSLITYRSEGGYGILDNIMNTVDLVYVVTVTIAIFLFGDRSSRFTGFDRTCLMAVLLIVLFWLFTRNHRITNILMQAVMVIAYFPVVRRLLELKENTEPFTVWIGMLIAPFIALLSSKGTLATIYSVRAILCVSILLLLMLRIELLKLKTNKNTENGSVRTS
jgi:hypothetical protein